MTGRPKGSKQVNPQHWSTPCVDCGASIPMSGSGRPKTICENCKKERTRRRSRMQYRRTKVLKQRQYTQTWRDYVRSVKVTIAECQDKLYCPPDLRCTNDNSFLFAFDHRDPNDKLFTISNPEGKKIGGRGRGHPRKLAFADFDAEIAKCDLVCHNCHAMRTHNGGHHKRLNMGEIPPIQPPHPTLWDEI